MNPFLAIALLALLGPTPPTGPVDLGPPPRPLFVEYVPGILPAPGIYSPAVSLLDYDADYDIDVADVAVVINHLGCRIVVDICWSFRWDVYFDGIIDEADVLAIMQHWNCRLGDACYYR
jgi:hypothetical protein